MGSFGLLGCCVQRESTICELLFPTSILSVKLNRKRMVVVLEEEIYIYDVSTMKLLHTIDTSVNPEGISSFLPLPSFPPLLQT
jgi:autophagy-related protein 18